MNNSTKFLKKRNSIFLAIGLSLAFIFAALVLFWNFRSQKAETAPISKDQIRIQKGDQIITINKNGLVEYRVQDRTYYETWDSSKINNFFSLMEDKAANNLNTGSCANCYMVTIFLNGKFVTVWIQGDDEDLTEVFVPFEYLTPTGSPISDYFNDDDGGSNGGGGSGSASPTPIVYSSPTPTVFFNYNSINDPNYPTIAAGCDQWSNSIVAGHAIISNTLCTVNPTQTP